MNTRIAPSVHRATDSTYVVSGFADSSAVLADRRMSSDPATGEHLHPDITNALGSDGLGRVSMQMCDAARHQRLRRAIAPALTPGRCAGPLARLAGRADDLLGDLIARGSGDLIAEFALPLAFSTICDLLGIPDRDRDRTLRWAEASTMPDPVVSADGGASLDEYLVALLATGSELPADSLYRELVAARESGGLSDAEAVGTAALMLIAGYETTVSFLGSSALILLMTPRLRDLLVRQPDLQPAAIEELLRYVTPTRGTWTRFATDDVPIGDVVVPAGSAVVVDLATANRDALRFAAPDRLDLSRADNRHLAFGHGPHYCPGATLARREAQVVLGVLMPRLGELELTDTELHWHENRFSRRPRSLDVVVTRRRATDG
ncbi:cytochrome P450 [Rhodococcus olei]|uniref:Cytochrome P450 n=1 Tax=Rhodococcus olei TaxID=2161675 RepID=A0ABP8PHW6_9NOCA